MCTPLLLPGVRDGWIADRGDGDRKTTAGLVGKVVCPAGGAWAGNCTMVA